LSWALWIDDENRPGGLKNKALETLSVRRDTTTAVPIDNDYKPQFPFSGPGKDGNKMSYNLEKYRDKREKVLGVKKRGLSFGILATLVSGIILFGLAVVVIPQSIAYFNTRHLDDAIFKLGSDNTWPSTVMAEARTLKGVKNVVTDKLDTRLVITFDRETVDLNSLTAFFKRKGFEAVLLNRINHMQNVSIQREEKELEAQ
jgi:hypothetical protein